MNQDTDRVAKAIYAVYQRRAIKHGWKIVGTVEWEDLAESTRDEYRDTAGAVLAVVTLIDSERMNYVQNREDA